MSSSALLLWGFLFLPEQVDQLILLCQEALESVTPPVTVEEKPATALVLDKSRHSAKNCGSKNFSITIDIFFVIMAVQNSALTLRILLDPAE